MNRANDQEAISLLYGEGCTRQEVASLQQLRRKYKDQTNILDQNSAYVEHLHFLRWLVAHGKVTEWPSDCDKR